MWTGYLKGGYAAGAGSYGFRHSFHQQTNLSSEMELVSTSDMRYLAKLRMLKAFKN